MRLIRARGKGSFDKRPKALEVVARLAAWLLAVLDVALLYEFLTRLSFLIHFGIPDTDAKVLYVALLVSPALALVVLAITLSGRQQAGANLNGFTIRWSPWQVCSSALCFLLGICPNYHGDHPSTQ